MTKDGPKDDATDERIAAFATFGARGLGASLLGGLFRESKSSLWDLGDSPIGSDPWLAREVNDAIARQPGVDASRILVDVRDAIVTLRGAVRSAQDLGRVEAAARTVQGVKRLQLEVEVA